MAAYQKLANLERWREAARRAIAQFERICEVSKNDPAARHDLVAVLSEACAELPAFSGSTPDDHRTALGWARRLVELSGGEDADHLEILATYQSLVGNRAGAVSTLEKALAAVPKAPATTNCASTSRPCWRRAANRPRQPERPTSHRSGPKSRLGPVFARSIESQMAHSYDRLRHVAPIFSTASSSHETTVIRCASPTTRHPSDDWFVRPPAGRSLKSACPIPGVGMGSGVQTLRRIGLCTRFGK